MNLPKIKFIDMPLTSEANIIHFFLLPGKFGWNWSKYILTAHPALKNTLLLENKKERVAFIKKYISLFRKKNKRKTEINRTRYEHTWRKIEVDFLKTLSEILEIDWPKSRRTIYAMTSINPICPRFLNKWSFSMFYNYKNTDKPMEVIMHECCHFLYFEKWQKLYPNMERKRFDAPYIE